MNLSSADVLLLKVLTKFLDPGSPGCPGGPGGPGRATAGTRQKERSDIKHSVGTGVSVDPQRGDHGSFHAMGYLLCRLKP